MELMGKTRTKRGGGSESTKEKIHNKQRGKKDWSKKETLKRGANHVFQKKKRESSTVQGGREPPTRVGIPICET